MLIEKEYSSHTGLIDVGSLALFLEVSKVGVEKSNSAVVKRARTYPTIVFKNPLEYAGDFGNLLAGLVKVDLDKHIIVYDKAVNKPKKIKGNNVKFYIELPLPNNFLESNLPINEDAVKWHKAYGSVFYFNIATQEDVDKALELVATYELSKNKVYFISREPENLEAIEKLALSKDVNFGVDFKTFLWEEEMEEDEDGTDNIEEGDSGDDTKKVRSTKSTLEQ